MKVFFAVHLCWLAACLYSLPATETRLLSMCFTYQHNPTKPIQANAKRKTCATKSKNSRSTVLHSMQVKYMLNCMSLWSKVRWHVGVCCCTFRPHAAPKGPQETGFTSKLLAFPCPTSSIPLSHSLHSSRAIHITVKSQKNSVVVSFSNFFFRCHLVFFIFKSNKYHYKT